MKDYCEKCGYNKAIHKTQTFEKTECNSLAKKNMARFSLTTEQKEALLKSHLRAVEDKEMVKRQ